MRSGIIERDCVETVELGFRGMQYWKTMMRNVEEKKESVITEKKT